MKLTKERKNVSKVEMLNFGSHFCEPHRIIKENYYTNERERIIMAVINFR